MASSKGTMETLLAYYWQDETEMLKHDERVQPSPSQFEMLKKWQEVFALLIEGRTPIQVRKHMQEKYQVSEQMAHRYISDAQMFFTEIDSIQKEPFRNVQVRKYQHMIQQLKIESGMVDNPAWEGEGDEVHPKKLSLIERDIAWHLIVEIEKRLDKITGLEEKDGIDINKLIQELSIPEVVISDDPSVLNIDNYQEAEETDED